ncbi:MAG: PHP domain-containing protein [Sulfolobales archaeon]|nr:PHP domain-containing protein [Sulfolobales archaeon]MCX8199416.1 PHP domain-containing protein [Sulfolobales archaeon]MDW8170270.1 CehA/McbA family metallohydrolase [Desulfurococcaceae archaeon]
MPYVKADLHIHTAYSDGVSSPLEVVHAAIDKGLNVIAVTDHDTFMGAVKARDYVKRSRLELLVLLGNEVRTELGDVLLYCLEEVSTSKNLLNLIEISRDNGCLIVPAHPFDILKLGLGNAIFEYRGWSAIEVWNASANKRANRMAIKASKELNLPGIASSDAHIVEYIGIAHSFIELSELSEEEVVESIRKGRVKPYFGYPSFNLTLKRFVKSVKHRAWRALST